METQFAEDIFHIFIGYSDYLIRLMDYISHNLDEDYRNNKSLVRPLFSIGRCKQRVCLHPRERVVLNHSYLLIY